MDPIVALWLASIAGAAGFTATGVFLARMLDGALVTTAPPPPAQAPEDSAELEAKLEAAEKRCEVLAKATKAADAARADLERQLESVRSELRADIVARTQAETRATQLESRLAGVARSRTSPGFSRAPASAPSIRAPTLSGRAPGLFAEIAELQKEVSRLRTENQTLLAASNANRRKRPTPKEGLVLPETEALRELVERVGRLDGVRGVVVADTMGSVLAGVGELLEPIGAFGAYVSDAASRVELLLPLESADEVVVRDRKLGVVSTLRLGDPRVELALVTLTLDERPIREMQQIIVRSGLVR